LYNAINGVDLYNYRQSKVLAERGKTLASVHSSIYVVNVKVERGHWSTDVGRPSPLGNPSHDEQGVCRKRTRFTNL
jgi:hypothetical protein